MTSIEIIRLSLCVNQFCIYYLLCSITDIVHLTHPYKALTAKELHYRLTAITFIIS